MTIKKNNKKNNKSSKIKKEKENMYNFISNKVFLATILFILTVLSLYINYVCAKKENFAIAEGVCKEDLPDIPEPEPTTTKVVKKCESILVHGEVDESIKEDIEEVISDVTEAFLPKDCCIKEKILSVITEIEKILAQKSTSTNNSESKFNQTELLTIQEKTECSIETIKLVNDVEFAQAYSFKYSPRPGTSAARLEKFVPQKVSDERLYQLQALLAIQHKKYNSKFLNKELEVFYKGKGKKEMQSRGTSKWMQVVNFKQTSELKEVMKVRIVEAYSNSLKGDLI